ncbi:MAG: hypothetical protein AB7D43_00210 [Sulfurimonadaceae bacterium]|jgi:hypothetical protein
MCNFNLQNDAAKALLSSIIKQAAQTLGGANFLLGLIETIRQNKPTPLTSSKCTLTSEHAILSWNKIIFKDKFLALEEALSLHKSADNYDFNLLDLTSEKKKKRVIGMIKTLAPVEFTIKPKNTAHGDELKLHIFETIDFEANRATINPLFVTLFFCSVEFSKKALKHEA